MSSAGGSHLGAQTTGAPVTPSTDAPMFSFQIRTASRKLRNWTFRNNICRIVIPNGASYGSDPRRVQSVLLTVASSHPEVLTAPEPSVTLDAFAAASLRFTLYAFVGDIAKAEECALFGDLYP
jgi:small-conductance mechanosensitive channel